jgi:predicted AAA+ superfamily ATPase
VPEIIQYLKIRIDGNREQYGRWILTGSQQFQLMKNVSELLAGRIAILEASYITFFLPPYFKNFGKRLNKAPKIYFLDTALVCALTRQPSASAALAGSMGGAFFEGWVVVETIKAFTSLGRKPDIYFWRSHDGLEVDLLIQIGTKIHPVEIKLTATPTANHLKPLNSFRKLAGSDVAEKGSLICRVKERKVLPNNNQALPWHEFPKWLRGELEKA